MHSPTSDAITRRGAEPCDPGPGGRCRGGLIVGRERGGLLQVGASTGDRRAMQRRAMGTDKRRRLLSDRSTFSM
jgi:hypothetical protein